MSEVRQAEPLSVAEDEPDDRPHPAQDRSGGLHGGPRPYALTSAAFGRRLVRSLANARPRLPFANWKGVHLD